MLWDIQGRLERGIVSYKQRILLDARGERRSQLSSEQCDARNSSWGSQDEGGQEDEEGKGEEGGFM